MGKVRMWDWWMGVMGVGSLLVEVGNTSNPSLVFVPGMGAVVTHSKDTAV